MQTRSLTEQKIETELELMHLVVRLHRLFKKADQMDKSQGKFGYLSFFLLIIGHTSVFVWLRYKPAMRIVCKDTPESCEKHRFTLRSPENMSF